MRRTEDDNRPIGGSNSFVLRLAKIRRGEKNCSFTPPVFYPIQTVSKYTTQFFKTGTCLCEKVMQNKFNGSLQLNANQIEIKVAHDR